MKEYKPKYNLSREENVFVAKRNIIDYIWKSAKLEGLAVTFPETEAIYNGMSVSGIQVDDIIAVNNLKHSWQFIFETLECETEYAYICELNRIVGDNNLIYGAGFIRNIPVKMGGTNWIPEMPFEVDIKEQLAAFKDIESPTERAITIMLYCMRSQMFVDGNKRTAMLAANHIMIRNGCGIISIPIELQQQFRKMLIEFYETNDMQSIKDFIYDNCIDGIELNKMRDYHKISTQQKKEKRKNEEER